MVRLEISGVTVSLGESDAALPEKAAAILGIPVRNIASLRIVRRSIDARQHRAPRFVYILEVSLTEGTSWMEGNTEGVTVRMHQGKSPLSFPLIDLKGGLRPVVIGCGPAGLFAALTLARRGIPPLLLERGRKVTERVRDVDCFWREGRLNPESHVHFGEGGAGTFSDGKLTSRVKNPYAGWVKNILVEMGASADILTEARPHIGTDRLREIVIRLRGKLVELGCEIRFEARVTDFLIKRNHIVGIVVNHREEIPVDRLILAIGQSADDTYQKLLERGVHLEPKPFAMGLRIEHPQALINEIQYGRWHRHPALPPADYFLTAKIEKTDRSVYTFCMCPGGRIIGSSAAGGGIVTNGMSASHRDELCANSAVVVNVRVEDFGGMEPLLGLSFRRHWEEQAFIQGGGDYYAPAQKVIDFLQNREGGSIGWTSFRPGVRAAALQKVLPRFVVEALREGLGEFDRKMRGFVSSEAHLIGVETRTSSPVRLSRGPNGQSVNTAGLYPCGEGAGYAGGIISSALDGIRAARLLI